MEFETLAIVGVGLIGGSAGLAARARGVVRRVVGVGRSAPGLRTAQARGCIDEARLDLAEAAREADLILVCTPVDRIAEHVLRLGRACKPGAILTDTGSTKDPIVRAIEAEWSGPGTFVGGHPLAGSEKRGPEFARPDLFEGRLVVLTPTPRTPAPAHDAVKRFWEALGSRVLSLLPQDHDDAVAVTSHMPHVAAAAIAHTLPERLRELAASGFRDTTRIAAGDPALWSAILSHNRGAVLAALARLRGILDDYRHALEANDRPTLERLLHEAKLHRDALDGPDPAIRQP